MFPALGFGARVPPSGKVSHEFFLVSIFKTICQYCKTLINNSWNSQVGLTNLFRVLYHAVIIIICGS